MAGFVDDSIFNQYDAGVGKKFQTSWIVLRDPRGGGKALGLPQNFPDFPCQVLQAEGLLEEGGAALNRTIIEN
jgi:hypothetical protein